MSREKIKYISEVADAKKEARRRYCQKYYLKNSNPTRRNRSHCKNESEKKQRMSETSRRWRLSHKDRLREFEKKYRKNNIQFRLRKILRARLCGSLKSQRSYKCNSTMKLLGCSVTDFKIYLESRFEVGMSWENYGKAWQIDHIMPCAIFDLTKPEHQKRCFHFSNMQPLFTEENQRKSAKSDNQFRLL